MSAGSVARHLEQIMETGIQLNPGTVGGSPAVLQMLAGLLAESASDALTAHAGGGQTSALALTSVINRVTTVATAGDSVRLPPSTPGLDVLIVNHGANAMQVYGAGTDTINDVATGTGVSQMANSFVLYCCSVTGKWYSEGLANGFFGSLQTFSGVDNLTALAGGGQPGATPLTAMVNRVTTVGTAADSVLLPATTGLPTGACLEVTVINAAAANSMNVFPASGDKINALSANTAFAVAANKTCTFVATAAGQWHSQLTA